MDFKDEAVRSAREAGIEIRENEPLAAHTSFRIGGPARWMAFPKTVEEVRTLLRLAREADIPVRLLGAGTNVLAPDGGVDALVLCLKDALRGVRLPEGNCIEAMAGETLASVAVFARKNGLTGLEFAHGIPGTLGGGVYMNAGAYGGELRQVVRQVTFLHADGRLETFENEDCAFVYRTSVFENMPGVIVSARLALQPGEPAAIEAKMRELMEKRRASQPLELPSAGSTFKRPAGHFAGPLIQDAGLKGRGVGGAKVSEKHAGFVVNFDHATAADVRATIALVQKTVYETSGVRLEPEVRIW